MGKIIFKLVLLALICAVLLYIAAHYFVKATEKYIAKKRFDKLDLREAILIFPFLNMEDRTHKEFTITSLIIEKNSSMKLISFLEIHMPSLYQVKNLFVSKVIEPLQNLNSLTTGKDYLILKILTKNSLF